MGLQPFNLGSTLLQAENVLALRDRRDPNNLQNQFLRAKINQLSQPPGFDIGQVNPRDFTAESIQRFQQTGDFNDLQRYESPKTAIRVDEGDAWGFYHPLSSQLIKRIPKNLGPAQTPDYKRAEVLARAEAEKETSQPKRTRAAVGKRAKTELLKQDIAKARKMATGWTTGLMGAIGSAIPGTAAHDLGQTLNTIKANIGFDKLQEMRESSPTGGALGQVSENENKLLQAVWGALEQSQSKAQFVENLNRLEKQIEESWQRVADAYEADYGVPWDGETVAPEGNNDNVVDWNNL